MESWPAKERKGASVGWKIISLLFPGGFARSGKEANLFD